MTATKRTGLLAATLALAMAPALTAQIPGMPLFTNPRYATGVRIHADYGMPTGTDSTAGDQSVIQAGLGLVLGPVGIDANVGTLRSDVKNLQICSSNPSGCDDSQKITASALLQLKVMGGGTSNLSLSLFGGASTDMTSYDVIDCTSVPPAQQTFCTAYRDSRATKQLTIPVGAAIGVRVPLGIASLNLWGAPRMNLVKFINCPSSNTAPCDAKMQSNFRWAVGADFPIFRILSIRASYESGKEGPSGFTRTTGAWGVGASIGIGGMR
jgi:hypothetical protein